ncbi:MAG: ATP-dependent RecD-like DNA helicase, partial [Alphaproteobacteria bacterium]|nr:ATP-dependent RecD-like DNA helicase [Alphaproteobacteria bacterium]
RTAILAPTHFIRAEIHRVVRDGLAREGVLHGRELELDRYANRHLTAAQRADVRNHEPGDIVLFHSRVPPLRVEKGDACRVMRREGEFVFLGHPTGRTVRIRPADNWVRYRFGLYETARIRIRAGDRIRWTMNDERRGLVNGGGAVVREIGSRRVRFELEDGRTLSLARTDPQLRHIDHAWSTTVHAAQGMTRDRAIGVLDTGHGALTGQAGLYVEASRARDRFVLVTNDRERLGEVLEANDGSRMTALEAVGEGEEDPPPGAPAAALAMLRGLEADWRRLVGQADSQGRDLTRMDGYARIATGAMMLAEDMALPADLRAFVDEVQHRDAQAMAERKQGFAFLRRAERHCRDWPLLKWAAAKRGRPIGDLAEHSAWLAEGKLLAGAGRQLEAASGRGIAARIAAALGRLVHSREVDEAERFREAAARHETEARAAGFDPRQAAGAEMLAAWAGRLRDRQIPEAARPAIEAWCAAAPATPPTPEDRKAALAIETFLLDCDGLLFDTSLGGASPPPVAEEPDPWEERAEALRRQGLQMLGDAPGAKLGDPLRIRLARVGIERERVREAVDRLARTMLQRRSDRFMVFVGMTGRQRREAGCDPVDLPSWAALRDRAAALRSEASLATGVRRAVDRVLDLDARAKAETRPVAAFLEASGAHLRRREALEEKAREAGIAPVALDDMTVWRRGSEDIRAAGRRLLGQAEAGAAEAKAATRLKDMPRLRGRVREVLNALRALKLQDAGDAFVTLADRVEARAAGEDTLALHAEEYGKTTASAKGLETVAELPEAARRRIADWLARDRRWNEDLATAARLAGGEGEQADPAARREAAAWPAVAEAIRRETARLARLPEAGRTVPWTGEEPLVPSDRVRIGAGGHLMEAIVVSAGQAGGMRPDDELHLRRLVPAGPASPPAMEPQVPYLAGIMVSSGCERAVWSDEGLRELVLARQQSVPSELCRTPCAEPVEGDRIAWTEDAGEGRVRTVEAQVTARADDIRYGSPRLVLQVLDASGPGAPEPGSDIERTAAAVAARGCFRAQWSDEAHRARILDPPVEEKSLKQEKTQTLHIDLSEDIGMSM